MSLAMFVITHRTADFGDKFVVRRHVLEAGASAFVPDAEPSHVGETIEGARGSLPPGLLPVAMVPWDDPVIVEAWV